MRAGIFNEATTDSQPYTDSTNYDVEDFMHKREGANVGEILMESKHLPKSAGEFLDDISLKIDTSEILEIVQVFCHKDNSTDDEFNRNEDATIMKSEVARL